MSLLLCGGEREQEGETQEQSGDRTYSVERDQGDRETEWAGRMGAWICKDVGKCFTCVALLECSLVYDYRRQMGRRTPGGHHTQ